MIVQFLDHAFAESLIHQIVFFFFRLMALKIVIFKMCRTFNMYNIQSLNLNIDLLRYWRLTVDIKINIYFLNKSKLNIFFLITNEIYMDHTKILSNTRNRRRKLKEGNIYSLLIIVVLYKKVIKVFNVLF